MLLFVIVVDAGCIVVDVGENVFLPTLSCSFFCFLNFVKDDDCNDDDVDAVGIDVNDVDNVTFVNLFMMLIMLFLLFLFMMKIMLIPKICYPKTLKNT